MDYLFGYKISDSKYPQMKIIETPKFILRPATLKGALIFLSTLAKKKYLDIYRLALTKTFFRLKFL